ncbi:hypothetical protein [Ornithinimicrobium kibberense]|uniref:hypothetical protein n=1 Tax=Ornithinimicrobium kibberense TaxID=282060 RepID=UPI0036092DFE
MSDPSVSREDRAHIGAPLARPCFEERACRASRSPSSAKNFACSARPPTAPWTSWAWTTPSSASMRTRRR